MARFDKKAMEQETVDQITPTPATEVAAETPPPVSSEKTQAHQMPVEAQKSSLINDMQEAIKQAEADNDHAAAAEMGGLHLRICELYMHLVQLEKSACARVSEVIAKLKEIL